MLRAEFPVHRNSTLNGVSSSGKGLTIGHLAAAPEGYRPARILGAPRYRFVTPDDGRSEPPGERRGAGRIDERVRGEPVARVPAVAVEPRSRRTVAKAVAPRVHIGEAALDAEAG